MVEGRTESKSQKGAQRKSPLAAVLNQNLKFWKSLVLAIGFDLNKGKKKTRIDTQNVFHISI